MRYLTSNGYCAVSEAEASRLAAIGGGTIGSVDDVELVHLAHSATWALWSDGRITTAIGLKGVSAVGLSRDADRLVESAMAIGELIAWEKACGDRIDSEFEALKPQLAAAQAAFAEKKAASSASALAEETIRAERTDRSREAAGEEVARWVEAHGSARLRRCLAEKIECAALYRDERLALERPGWRWYGAPAGEEARNPPEEEAFGMLDAARVFEPRARLVFWERTGRGGEYASGYVAIATFLGRDAVFGFNPEDG